MMNATITAKAPPRRTASLRFFSMTVSPVRIRKKLGLLYRCRKSVSGLGADRTLHQRRGVEDQRDLAVAEDGRPADPGEPLEQPAERLDDGLEFAEQRVDHQPGALAGVVDDHDVLALARPAAHLEHL